MPTRQKKTENTFLSAASLSAFSVAVRLLISSTINERVKPKALSASTRAKTFSLPVVPIRGQLPMSPARTV